MVDGVVPLAVPSLSTNRAALKKPIIKHDRSEILAEHNCSRSYNNIACRFVRPTCISCTYVALFAAHAWHTHSMRHGTTQFGDIHAVTLTFMHERALVAHVQCLSNFQTNPKSLCVLACCQPLHCFSHSAGTNWLNYGQLRRIAQILTSAVLRPQSPTTMDRNAGFARPELS